MNQKVLSLIQECCKRWWSILNMICRILDIKDPVNATLGQKGKAQLIQNTSDVEQLQAVAMLMGIFQAYSIMLGGQRYVTMSYLKVMLVMINGRIQDTTTDSQVIEGMMKVMRDNLSLR